MGDVLTVEEINARYPDQWVLLADPVTDENLEVLSGRVAAAGTDRDAVYEAAVTLRAKRIATLFTGQPPPDMVFAL